MSKTQSSLGEGGQAVTKQSSTANTTKTTTATIVAVTVKQPHLAEAVRHVYATTSHTATQTQMQTQTQTPYLNQIGEDRLLQPDVQLLQHHSHVLLRLIGCLVDFRGKTRTRQSIERAAKGADV